VPLISNAPAAYRNACRDRTPVHIAPASWAMRKMDCWRGGGNRSIMSTNFEVAHKPVSTLEPVDISPQNCGQTVRAQGWGCKRSVNDRSSCEPPRERRASNAIKLSPCRPRYVAVSSPAVHTLAPPHPECSGLFRRRGQPAMTGCRGRCR